MTGDNCCPFTKTGCARLLNIFFNNIYKQEVTQSRPITKL
jgi:hypothetical protein